MKKEKKKIITVPDGWADINIYTFQELKNVKKKKIYETISILTDEDPEEVKTWDMASLFKSSRGNELVKFFTNY